MRIISKKSNNAVGTVTIHCEPVDYRQLVSKTQDVVAHNAKAMPQIIEVAENVESMITEQGDIYVSMGTLFMKLDTFMKLVDRLSEVIFT